MRPGCNYKTVNTIAYQLPPPPHKGFSTCKTRSTLLRGTQNVLGSTRQATLIPNPHAYFPKKGLYGVHKMLVFLQRITVFENG